MFTRNVESKSFLHIRIYDVEWDRVLYKYNVEIKFDFRLYTDLTLQLFYFPKKTKET